ncbi:hypothetical protein CVO76_11935 [Arthrobacter agilis]|uniref:Uncharacterized protein n=1 Tax=Arthrobacter agilis TaxID=37921 RepID=A0A2L0UGB8_9MICC|nr:hypothetical protein CVO76_11935 [Arthrobacter agilis]
MTLSAKQNQEVLSFPPLIGTPVRITTSTMIGIITKNPRVIRTEVFALNRMSSSAFDDDVAQLNLVCLSGLARIASDVDLRDFHEVCHDPERQMVSST